MIGIHSYEEIITSLTSSLKGCDKGTTLAGILFARPGSLIANQQIIPNLPYFHRRSGSAIDFFCIGYGGDEGDTVPLDPTGSAAWHFSPRRFDDARREIESNSKWKYKGGVELILVNGKISSPDEKAVLDFETAVVCRIDELIESKAITNVEVFFEEIIRFTESELAEGSDPASVFSDQQGGKRILTLITAMTNLFKGDVEKAFQSFRRIGSFATQDLSISDSPVVKVEEEYMGVKIEPFVLYAAVATVALPMQTLPGEVQRVAFYGDSPDGQIMWLPLWTTLNDASKAINNTKSLGAHLPEVLNSETYKFFEKYAASQGRELKVLISPTLPSGEDE